jgi:heme/copper-type cytochrome/quinol oxidase subunit 2
MTTTTIIILVNVGIIVLGVNFYVIWNLLKKNERLEDALNTQQDDYIQNISY